jgi:hypothetical protein
MKTHSWRRVALVVLVLVMSACANKAPASLSPVGVRYWQGDEAVVALGTLQHVAIQLNGVEICAAAPAPPDCHPAVSRKNTEVVVDVVTVALTTMKAAPAGWKATSLTALDQIADKLDAAGQTQLAGYLSAVRTIIDAL